jgi:NAD(P)-dependent dehydrogenase (short-subunit alcohol dehydrogenase family)
VTTAVVTGAGRGIGRGIAHRLAADGFGVVVADIEKTSADAVAAEISGTAVQCDVTDPASVQALADAADDVEVLVNNAGIYIYTSLMDTSPDNFHAVMNVNVLGPLLCTQAFVPKFQARGGGSIVNIASMAAAIPVPGTGMYPPSKAAVLSLTRLAALELGPAGIRVNAVGPGRIYTEGSAERYADPEREERTRSLIPAGRAGEPADIADVVSFFASADSRYVTGQILYVDGGLTQATIPLLQRAQSG